MKLAADLRKRVDRSQFDIDALLEALDYDEARIIAFVRERIAFEPYSGALRGAQGTLVSQAGNALDKSVLMARLLKDAGLSVRIGHARLEKPLLPLDGLRNAAAPAPLREPKVQASSGRVLADAASRSPMIASLLAQVEESRAAARPLEAMSEHADSSAIAERLHRLLMPAHEARIRSEVDRRLQESLRDAYWVEFQRSPGEEWKRVSVVAEGDRQIAAAKALRYFSDAVPPELVHRLRIELALVQRSPGGEKLTALAAPFELVPANRALRPLTLQIASTRMLAATDAPMPPEGAISDIFVPTLDGRPLPNGFDPNGQVVPAAEAGSMMAGVFVTGAGLVRRAADALGGADQPAGPAPKIVEVPGFSAVRVVLTLIDPAGRERREQRDIVNADWLPKHDQAAYNAAFYGWLTRQFTIGIATGAIGDDFLLNDLIDRVVRRADDLRRLQPEASRKPPARPARSAESGVAWLPMNLMLRLIDVDAARSGQHRYAPAVVMHSRSYAFGDIEREATDIVFSPRQGLQPDSLRALLRAGAWESMVEGAMLPGRSQIRSAVDGAYRIVNREDLDALGSIEPLLAGQIRADLARGHLVLANPVDVARSRNEANYWRVAAGGEAVRIGAYGEGSQLTERQVVNQIVVRLMCMSTFYGMCTQALNLAKPIAVVATIGTNADEIQFLLLAANTISGGLGGPSLDIPETAATDGIVLYGAVGAAARLQAAQAMLRRRCLEHAAKICGSK